MDPNTALARLRGLTHEYHNAEVPTMAPDDMLEEAMNLFAALDEWLSRDGFLPDAWKAEEDR